MHCDQLNEYRKISQAVDVYLFRSFREVTHRGPDPELQAKLDQLLPGEGLYLDIGANDPIQLSNTWPLYQRGWRGLLVEPDPSCWFRLLRERPRDWLWPTAFSDAEGKAVMRCSMSGVSSLQNDWACPPDARAEIVELKIGRNVLNEFYEIRDKARLCSIDVEGHEANVILGLDLTRFRPEVFVVENLRYDPDRPKTATWPQWQPYLEQADYELVFETADEMNRVYARKDSHARHLANV